MSDTRIAPNQALMPLTAQRDASGHLVIGGCDTVALAARFGTPLYVLDETTVRAACRAYVTALERHYPGASTVLYASKAHCTVALLALVHQEGLGVDVVSAGELHTALAAGIPAEKLVLQGNNKTPDELEYALRAGVGRINVDNLDEIAAIVALAERLEARPRVLLRVAPGIEAHTHEFIRTGQEDSKFGLDLRSGQLEQAIAMLKAAPRVQWMGLQAHIGSQIFDAASYVEAARVMVALLAELRERHGLVAAELDLGGGLGIPYVAGDDPPAIEATVAALAEAVRDTCERHGLPLPRLVLEPGRSIVGNAGVTLYRVGTRKEVPGVRTYVAVDGGMADNPRPMTYGAHYTLTLANREGGASECVTIAGRYCESGDLLAHDVTLPSPRAGDLLAMFSTGAYHHAMASNYNRVGRPAMVLVHAGEAELVVARESLDDLIRLDRLPARLRVAR